ncbi:amidohydrolase family protein [Williamsia herbipolensis]|uniref:amidohydrolase family protein n=1 Tax=Williamsia herbipolensis TaxID=1603258 RepID=UPI000A5A6A79|nr:amidohydrolase family protein [Williamsia herbipolensis]
MLLTGATVITMAHDRPRHEAAEILVVDGVITEIGVGIVPPGRADVVDLAGRIITPGLVNAHLHTWQSALRLVGADWTLPEYLARVHGDAAHRYSPDDMRVGTALGATAQIDAGVTTIGDWCHNCLTHEHAVGAIGGLVESGIRAVFLHGTPHGLRERTHDLAVFDRLVDGPVATTSLITAGMAIKGPQLSSATTAVADMSAARERGVVVTMHQSNGVPGDAWDTVDRHRLWGPRVNIVHGTQIPTPLLRRLLDRGVTFTSTPENELGQGHRADILSEVAASGGILSLGTDSDAFGSGDVRVAARVALSRHRAAEHERSLAATGMIAESVASGTWDALRWATIGGAHALGLADSVGTLEVGKRADLLVVDATGVAMWPHHDPVAAALHAHPGTVEAVLVDGRWRKRDHALVGVDVADLQARAWRSGSRLVGHLRADGVHRRVRREVVRRVVHRQFIGPREE